MYKFISKVSSSQVTDDDPKTTSSGPIWWEMLVFRGLNFIMVSVKVTNICMFASYMSKPKLGWFLFDSNTQASGEILFNTIPSSRRF